MGLLKQKKLQQRYRKTMALEYRIMVEQGLNGKRYYVQQKKFFFFWGIPHHSDLSDEVWFFGDPLCKYFDSFESAQAAVIKAVDDYKKMRELKRSKSFFFKGKDKLWDIRVR